MLALGDDFVGRSIGTLQSATRCPSSQQPPWASRNLVGKLSGQVFSDQRGDHRCRHVFLATAHGPEDAPHEYADCPTFVEFAVDENKSFCSVDDSLGFHLVGGELPLD
jgi:hypothetical protein